MRKRRTSLKGEREGSAPRYTRYSPNNMLTLIAMKDDDDEEEEDESQGRKERKRAKVY
jgi:hypothetical protein